MSGMNAKTGKTLLGLAHLEQSIRDILTTPVGTRVIRRDYGSQLPYLLDQPTTPDLIGQMQAMIADALQRYEPRIRFTRILVNQAQYGQLDLTLEGYYLLENQVVAFNNMQLF